ncbi:MAG: hypothetical protein KAS72_13750 [Phycisphaerales bacterium]|nr:hypothetical protein [Phycisphaerales bacterium]
MTRSIARKAIKQRMRNVPAGLLLAMFFGVFFVMGSGFFYFIFLRPVSNVQQASRWIETPCQIVASGGVCSMKRTMATSAMRCGRCTIVGRITADVGDRLPTTCVSVGIRATRLGP